jgi:anti-anti-sigma factor
MASPRDPPLRIEVAATAGMATVVINGELDVTTTPLLRRQLAQVLEGTPRRLVFDMSGVDFMDCAAARLIARTAPFLPEGCRPVIQRPSPVVRRLLELTGVAAHCEVDDLRG